MWYVLLVVALVGLLIFPRRKVIRGTLGVAVGATIVNAAVFFSSGVAVRWDHLGKGIVIAMLSALAIELIARLFGGRKQPPSN